MRRTTTTATAALVLLPLVVGTAASPALAADSGDVTVTNTETVQARLSATGSFQGARVYEQLALTGHGTATIANPVSTEGLRNLDGFGGHKVVDGKLVSTLSVDGERRERSLSTYDKDLPLTVEVTYTFDGEAVQPGAIIGKAGTLGVHYKVTNTTGKTQDVTYDDGTGTMATASAETVIPMIGQLVTVLPSTFTDVRSDEAGMAGDGRGGTRMQFQMTLFPPIGSATAEFGYTAQVSRAVIPKATLTSMPVSPLEYPSFKGGAASYQAGAQKGVDLTAGATKIDDSVLQLHDGAAQLLAGLLQLRDGAAKLSTGLNDTAAPGAAELAAGLNGKLAPGAAKLATGLGDAGAGASRLSAGLNKLAPGAAKLDAGLNGSAGPGASQLSAGLNDKLAPGAARLSAGLNGQLAPGAAQVAAGASSLDAGLAQVNANAPALLDGLMQVGSGLDLVDAGLATLYAGIGTLPAQAQGLHDGIAQLRTATSTLAAGVDQIRIGVSGAVTSASNLSAGSVTLGNQLSTGIGALTSLRAGMNPAYLAQYDAVLAQLSAGVPVLTDTANPATIAGGAAALSQGLAGAATNLTKVQCGLSSASLPGVCDATKPGVLEGLAGVDAGVTQLVDGVVASVQGAVGDVDDTSTDGTLRGGVHSLQAGTNRLNAGGATLASGLTALGAGASTLSTGSRALSAGLDDAATGSQELSAGVSSAAVGSRTLSEGLAPALSGIRDLSTGLNEAAAGSRRLSDGLAPAVPGSKELSAGVAKAAAGSQRLSDGLGDAADGSTQLSDGLDDAAEGAPKLVDGTQQLSDEGTSQVVVSGQSTAEDFGVKYAVLSAGAERAQTEGMAYGAPDGATGATAYSIEIAGVDGTGASSVGRLILAIVLFAGGIGLATLARRRFV